MKVINIHKRIIDQPKEEVSKLIRTLSSENDQVWPKGKWPAMKLDQGLQQGSKGGHGPIRYTIDKYVPDALIQFVFLDPKGFNGCHRFEIIEEANDRTTLKHTIEMSTSGIGTLTWTLGIRWLHDALIEDAFDNVENHFSKEKKVTRWNLWVKVLRGIFS